MNSISSALTSAKFFLQEHAKPIKMATAFAMAGAVVGIIYNYQLFANTQIPPTDVPPPAPLPNTTTSCPLDKLYENLAVASSSIKGAFDILSTTHGISCDNYLPPPPMPNHLNDEIENQMTHPVMWNEELQIAYKYTCNGAQDSWTSKEGIGAEAIKMDPTQVGVQMLFSYHDGSRSCPFSPVVTSDFIKPKCGLSSLMKSDREATVSRKKCPDDPQKRSNKGDEYCNMGTVRQVAEEDFLNRFRSLLETGKTNYAKSMWTGFATEHISMHLEPVKK